MAQNPSPSRKLPAGMRALEHRNFRLYFAGQAVSILGSWIQQVALSWLVYRLTGSAALLGITAFCGLIPQLVVGPFAGAWIDKHDKKKWLVGVQSLMALQAFVLAGLLLGLTSEAFCFAINGFSFLALITAILVVRSTPPARAKGSVGEVFKEGLAYAWHTWSVRTLILTLIALNLTASAYAVLLPVFARDVFAGDAQTLGWLWGAAGCGAFASTIFLATRKSVPGLIASVVSGTAIAGISLLVFAATDWLPLALIGMVGVGFGISVCNVGINMILQSTAPEQFRGRIVSFFTSARFGFDALGGLLAGFIAAGFGAGHTLLAEGGVLLIFVVFLFSRRQRLAEQVSIAQGASHGH